MEGSRASMSVPIVKLAGFEGAPPKLGRMSHGRSGRTEGTIHLAPKGK